MTDRFGDFIIGFAACAVVMFFLALSYKAGLDKCLALTKQELANEK